MDSMDYHVESMSSVYFEAPFQVPRRCPYANSNSRNPHLTHRASSFVPSLHYSTQQAQGAWPPYPYLPPPMPSAHLGYHNAFGHPVESSFASFPRGLREQVSLQHINMADNAETGSHSSDSFQSNPYEGVPPVSATEAAWRTAGAASSHDNVLPPLGSNSLAAGNPAGNASSQQTPSRYGHAHGDTSRNLPRIYPPSTPRLQREIARLFAEPGMSPTQSTTSADELEDMQSYLSGIGFNNPTSIEAFVDGLVPQLENENNMRMDDQIRTRPPDRRMEILRSLVARDRERRSVVRKPGASKTALASLAKIPIKELEEDDRTCQICYNDYGVENPEGAVEHPLQFPNCKHAFGDTCLKKWLEEKNTCPYCRDQLPPDPPRSHRGNSEFRRSQAERERQMAHTLTRQAMREQNSMRNEVQQIREQIRDERMNSFEERPAALYDLERSPYDQYPYESSATLSEALTASHNRPMLQRPSYANPNSSASRRARGMGNSSRESRHSTTTLQPTSTQQMPIRTPTTSAPRTVGEESMDGFYMGTNSSGRVGPYSGDARLPGASSFADVDFPSSHPQSQNHFGGFSSYQNITASQYNSNFNYRDLTRQDRNHRLFAGQSPNYGRFSYDASSDTSRTMHQGSNHTVDSIRGRDNHASLPRIYPSGPQPLHFPQREPNPRAVDADLGERMRMRPDYSTDRRAASRDEMNSSPAYWSYLHEARYSTQSGHDASRDHNVLSHLTANSQLQPSQEQNALNFTSMPPGEYNDESFPGTTLPPSGTHSNPEAEYQNSRNENASNDVTSNGYYADTS